MDQDKNNDRGKVHKEKQSKLMVSLADRYFPMKNEINTLVEEISNRVSILKPDLLMHRSCWQLAHSTIVNSEYTDHPDVTRSLRMVDYMQSVICAVKPGKIYKDDVTDDDYSYISERIEKLFGLVSGVYQSCRTARESILNENFNRDLDEFRVRYELHWVNVRGKRYFHHQTTHLYELLSPHSKIFEELFGIDSLSFVREVDRLQYQLNFGFVDALEEYDNLLSMLQNKHPDLIMENVIIDIEEGNISKIKDESLLALYKKVKSKMQTLEMFNVKKITSLPQYLIDKLTWSPGENTDFFAPGEYCGWPFRMWPTMERPFLRLNSSAYCFDLYSLLDRLYRTMQSIILKLRPNYADAWRVIQTEVSERTPFEYFQELLPGASVWRAVYYRWKTGSGKHDWMEIDGVLAFDDHLFVIEIKGARFFDSAPDKGVEAHIKSLTQLIGKPTKQTHTFLEYLNSSDAVQIFDKKHSHIGEISRSDYKQITLCAITLDSFTEIASGSHNLGTVGVEQGGHPLWTISIDDLRVYKEIFVNPLIFLHYLKCRIMSTSVKQIEVLDEMDFIGLYFAHNNFISYFQTGKYKEADKVFVNGYSHEIDRYYSLLTSGESPPVPRQDMPLRIQEIVDALGKCDVKGRIDVACIFLDLSGAEKNKLNESIDNILNDYKTNNKPRFLSICRPVNATVCVWTPSVPRNYYVARSHILASMLACGESKRWMIELIFETNDVFVDVKFQDMDIDTVPPDVLKSLANTAKIIKRRRDIDFSIRTQCGPNDPCLCGSGKKFKKCCRQ